MTTVRGWARARAWARAYSSGPRPSGPRHAQPALPFESMPSPRGVPGQGTLPAGAAGGKRLHEYVDACHRELGPVFRLPFGPSSVVFVAEPSEMRRVFTLEGKHPRHEVPEAWRLYNDLYGCQRGLFFMDGEPWLRTRRIMNKMFLRPDQADLFAHPCKLAAENLLSKWKDLEKSNGRICIPDLESALYKWSLDTVIAVMTGSLYQVHAERWDEDVKFLSANVHKIFLESGSELLSQQAQHARDCNLPEWRRFKEAVSSSLSAARSLVIDMISFSSSSSDCLLADMLKEGMSEDDIVKVIADFVIAAGDTTALSLQWILYLLAKHPEIQENVASEICKETDFMQSGTLRGVIREALRLYPVAPFLTRVMPDSCVIGGYELPSEVLVCISLFTSGRDAKNFPRPEAFLPQRWLRHPPSGSYEAVLNPYASMPFSMGARSCIGKKLAETQMMMTVASILKLYRIELLNSGSVEMILRLVAVPSEPIQIALLSR